MKTPDSRLTRRAMLAGGAAVGLAGVVGCSNEGRGGETGNNDDATRSQVRPAYVRYEGVKPDLAGAEFNIPDAFLRYPAEPVDAIAEPPGDGEPISVTTYTNTPIPPKLAQNAFWQELNKEAGSPVTVSLTPSVDYNQKFATSVAGNTLGDIFMVGGIPQVPQMLAAKAADLTPHLSGDNIKKYPFLANLPETGWNGCIFGGKVYAIPIPRGAISSSVLYSRADMIEAQGLKAEVKSADDFVELCKGLSDKRKNRFALATAPTNFVRNMFDQPSGWAENGDGSLTSFREHESHEAVFEILTRLWKEGYIHPDAYSGQNQDMKARFNNGTSPLVHDTFSGWQTYLQTKVQDAARIAIIPPPKADGSGQGQTWLGGPTIGVTAINKKAEARVETLLSYLNFLAAPFGTQEYLFRKYGLEGVHHEMVDGKPVLNEKGFSESQLGLSYQADGPWTVFLPEDASSTQVCFDAMKEICPNAIDNPVSGMYSETDRRKGPQINEALDDVAEDIITGRKPISAWAAGVKKWKSDGGDKIAEEFAKVLAESR
ncbi:extracellular solute-binding protein [Microlunatus speluncae]|uniref:extracellular solute-binding protein n=1 Tax=Microlunatus speluncae TaxID=2594267 RepID=UPI0012665FB3|nr:extracellular solute-binding protein [Microlunatus speluncae]